jgi:hypothetical protein
VKQNQMAKESGKAEKMKKHTVSHKTQGRATAPVKAAPANSPKQSKRVAVKAAAKNDADAKPIRLLLERFPDPNKEFVLLQLYAPQAETVFVAGSFNDWQPTALPLQKQAADRWVVELKLAPGRYEYRFVVDGQWIDDPLSPAYVSNPFDGLNCVLVAAGE